MTPMAVNEASNLLGFLEAWSDPDHERNHMQVASLTTAGGRITGLHDPAPGRGPLVAKHHPRFAELLEPGVRDMVLRLVTTWNLVTYSSCEGHQLSDGRIMPWCVGALDLGNTAFHVLTLLQQSSHAPCAVGQRANLHIERGRLRSAAVTVPVAELSIRPAPGVTWGEYAAVRQAAVDTLCEAERLLARQLEGRR